MEHRPPADPEVVKLAPVQTIACVAETRRLLLDAMARSACVKADCSGLSEFDLSFLQVLIAARRSAGARGVALSLTAPASAPLRDSLQRAGLLGGGADDKFWTEATP